MSIKKGTTAIVDRYKGSRLIERAYKGTDLIYDAYSEVDGSLPLTFDSRAAHTLTDYTVHGTAAGAGVETENLWDEDYENISFNLTYKSINVGDGEFTLSTTAPLYSGACCLFLLSGQQTSGASTSANGVSANLSRTVTSVDGYVTIAYRKYGGVDPRDYQTMLVKGSTAPASYIPPGYQISLTVTSGQNTDTYPLYIGDTKLGVEEYVDYSEQKIYKDVSGTLTPTDPPLPFPAISAYQGENTLSSTETVGSVTVKGRISEVQDE